MSLCIFISIPNIGRSIPLRIQLRLLTTLKNKQQKVYEVMFFNT